MKLRATSLLGFFVMSLVLGTPLAQAAKSSLALGYGIYTGPDTNSMTGSSSFSGILSSESEGRFLRFSAGFEGHYTSGYMNYGSTLYLSERMGVQARLGTHIQTFPTARLRPIIGVYALLALDLFRGSLTNSSTTSSTTGFGLGYEIEGGVGFSAGPTSEFRVLAAYEILSERLGSRDIGLNRISGRLALTY